jgi:hypothetical protein
VPSGTVRFLEGATLLGSSTLDANGKATLNTAGLAAGIHNVTAQYTGNTGFGGSTSAALTQTVNKANTTTTVASNRNPSNGGQPITFKATVAPGAATGTVQFFDGAVSLGSAALSSGTASLTTSALSTGTHSITAQYGGDANYNGSTSAVLNETVNRKK